MQNPLKCLLVDDDADDQDVFKMAVATLKFPVEVETASSGAEAFEKMKQESLPDCIFLDLNMPLMNGREFIKKIKSMSRLMDIPVVIYSTSRDAKDKTDLMLLGARQFIIKPNSVKELIGILDRELARVKA